MRDHLVSLIKLTNSSNHAPHIYESALKSESISMLQLLGILPNNEQYLFPFAIAATFHKLFQVMNITIFINILAHSICQDIYFALFQNTAFSIWIYV